MISGEKMESQKKKLEEMKASLEAEIKRLETPVDVGDFPGEDENADESAATFNQRAMAASFRNELDEVESALEKIAKGTYGKCEQCGEEIEAKLIEITPEARFCMSCNKENVVKK